jgi:SM-20-related protein
MQESAPEALDKRHGQLANALAEPGYAVVPDYLSADLALRIAAEAQGFWRAGAFHAAGVGSGNQPKLRPDIRGDEVYWLDPAMPAPSAAQAIARLRSLQTDLNEKLFAGLEDLEVHFARYPRGGFYGRHIDQFEDTNRRAFSVVLYLNHQWKTQDGGQLRLWTTPAPGRTPPTAKSPYLEVWPQAGTLVIFRSADFWHEVRRARRPRLSLTGWFLRRADNPLLDLL